MKFLILVFLFIRLNTFGKCGNILAVFPFPAFSHYSPFEQLVRKLSDNGHEVTVISHFPQKTKNNNLTDIDISGLLPPFLGTMSPMMGENLTLWFKVKYMTEIAGFEMCEPVLTHPEIVRLLESDRTFDLIVSELFGTECFLGFVHKFQAPWVGVISSVPLPWSNDVIGGIENPSYVPHYLSAFSDRMNIFERFLNAGELLAMKMMYKFYSALPSYEIAKKHFGPDLPDFNELRSRLALVLVNSHPAVTAPRPLPPAIKEVGGIQIPNTGLQPLPNDMQNYLDEAVDGVIYFSFGSQMNATMLSHRVLQAILTTFLKLAPRRVLWKCNENEILGLPKNVKCVNWIPQFSVLCHPNVKVFMSHGGLLGIQEAIFCGTPILGMPIFGDQFLNLAYGRLKGYTIQMDLIELNEDDLYANLQKLLSDPSYSLRAKEASRKFRDRPVPPLDEAVFWVEYVLRNGPQALKTAASELAWYQYLLLDVVVVTLIALYSIYHLIKKAIRTVFFYIKRKPVYKPKLKLI